MSIISTSQQKKHEITTPFQSEKKKDLVNISEGPYCIRGGMIWGAVIILVILKYFILKLIKSLWKGSSLLKLFLVVE